MSLKERQLSTVAGSKASVISVDYAEVDEVAHDLGSMSKINRRKSENDIQGYLTEHSDWFGGLRDVAHAKELLEHGWREGADRIEELAREIEQKLERPVSVKRQRVRAAEGDDLSWDRLRNGQIDKMWDVAKRESGRSPRVVRIIAQIGGNCARSQEEMFWPGGTMLAVASLLESAGYRCELVAGWCSTGHANPYDLLMALVLIKEAKETMRMDSLAFAASHAGFFRYYGLMMEGHHPSTLHVGHGVPAALLPQIKYLVDKHQIAPVDAVIPELYKREEAVKYAQELLVALTDPSVRPGTLVKA